jgi:hypothetical protein
MLDPPGKQDNDVAQDLSRNASHLIAGAYSVIIDAQS